MAYRSADDIEYVKDADVEEATDKVGMGRFHWQVYVIVGLFTAADSVEIGFISFVVEILKEKWGLTESAKATMESMIFLGMLLGAPSWGYLADKFGRRNAMLVSAALVSVFGFATALAPNTQVLIPMRFCVGFGCAGCVVAFDVFAETLPTDWRGPMTMSTFYWFTAGSLYSNISAKYFLCSYGWQVYTVICALPTLIAAIAGYFLVPESTHWLVAEDRNEEAAEVMNSIALKNGAPVRFERLTQPEVLEEFDTLDLCKRSKLRKPLIFMAITWVGWGLAYYGIALLLPHLFQGHDAERSFQMQELSDLGGFVTEESRVLDYNPGVSRVIKLSKLGDDNSTDVSCTPSEANCYCLEFDFLSIMISNGGQALGLTVGIMLIDRVGRVKTQQIMYIIAAIFAVGLGFPDIDRRLLTVFSTISLACTNGGSACTWSHTPELFPTHARVLATGLCSSAARVGAASAPYVISDLIPPLPTALIMASFSLMAAISISFVRETAGAHIENDNFQTSCDEADWSE